MRARAPQREKLRLIACCRGLQHPQPAGTDKTDLYLWDRQEEEFGEDVDHRPHELWEPWSSCLRASIFPCMSRFSSAELEFLDLEQEVRVRVLFGCVFTVLNFFRESSFDHFCQDEGSCGELCDVSDDVADKILDFFSQGSKIFFVTRSNHGTAGERVMGLF